jgi:hypothetical protein
MVGRGSDGRRKKREEKETYSDGGRPSMALVQAG